MHSGTSTDIRGASEGPETALDRASMHQESRETRFSYTACREPTSMPCSIYGLPHIDEFQKNLASGEPTSGDGKYTLLFLP